jgi:long-chain acyl-CoA synthetase
LVPHYNFKNSKIFHKRFSNGLSSRRGFRLSCETKVIHVPF